MQEISEDIWLNYLSSPLTHVLINSEGAPVNSFPRSTTSTKYTAQWIFDTLADSWAQWIGADNAETLRRNSGSYAIDVPNTNLKYALPDVV